MQPPPAEPTARSVASGVHQLHGWLHQPNTWMIGVGAGLLLLTIPLVLALWRRSQKWLPVSARVLKCSAEVVPSLLQKDSRKEVLFTHVVVYELDGVQHNGVCTTRDTRHKYDDIRRYVRTVVGQEVRMYLRAGSHGKLRLSDPPKPLDRRLLIVTGALSMICMLPTLVLRLRSQSPGDAATDASEELVAERRQRDSADSKKSAASTLKLGTEEIEAQKRRPIIVQH